MAKPPASEIKRQHAAVLVATGHSDSETATKVKVHRNTIINWRTEPEFQKLVQRERVRYLKDIRLRTGMLAPLAFKRLERILKKSKNDNAAVRAALAVLITLGGIAKPDKILGDESGKKVIKVRFVSPPRLENHGPDGAQG